MNFLEIFLSIGVTPPLKIRKQSSLLERLAKFQIIILKGSKEQCALPIFSYRYPNDLKLLLVDWDALTSTTVNRKLPMTYFYYLKVREVSINNGT